MLILGWVTTSQKLISVCTCHPGPLSLAILHWQVQMSTGDGLSGITREENGKFCIAVCHSQLKALVTN